MKFQIQNIGHIPHAEIDLDKKLIILCGANNTGKTYLAYSIYGFFKFLRGNIENLISNSNIDFINESEISENTENKIDFVTRFFEKKDEIIKIIQDEYKKFLSTIFATYEDFFKNTILKLDFDKEKISEYLLQAEISHLLIPMENPELSISLKKEKNNSFLCVQQINVGYDEVIQINQYKNIYKRITRYLSKTINKQKKEYLNITIGEIIFKNYLIKTYIAPVERLVINIFSKELSARNYNLLEKMKNVEPLEAVKYLEQLSRFSLPVKDNLEISNNLDVLQRQKSEFPYLADEIELEQLSRFSLPVKDNLEISNNLDVLQRQKSEFPYLADEIEREILSGKVDVSEYNTMQFTPNETTTTLNFNMSASVIKSLASIVFYCRHLAQKNDFLIIDEPELNLHPDNQRKIARVIVQMINTGIKVMISTHSDYIIKELNNLMMLHIKDKSEEQQENVKKLMQKYGYKENQMLDFEDVGVYLFTQNRQNGTNQVKPLEVTNTGFEVESIDDEINKINDTAQTIFLTLHNKGD